MRRTVSGLTKILHPDGQVEKQDMVRILKSVIEGRRRVKEELKKMGSCQTSFSYLDSETGEEHYVGVPEQGGPHLISSEPLAPGTLYTGAVSGDGTVGLYRLEITPSGGTGKLKLAGGVRGATKESIQRAFAFLKARKVEFGIGREMDAMDLNVEAVDILSNKVEAEVGTAFVTASYSALRRSPPQPGMLVLGDISIQGNVKAARSLVEPLQVAVDNGARRVLIPIENKRSFFDVNGDVLEAIDPIFYGDMRQAAFKALGLN